MIISDFDVVAVNLYFSIVFLLNNPSLDGLLLIKCYDDSLNAL